MSNNDNNFFNNQGQKLIDNGLDIIPTIHSEKRPAFSGWQKKPRMETAKVSGGPYGVGIRTRHFPAIDLDIRDNDTVKKMLDHIGQDMPVRVGKAPKALVPCVLVGDPFKKMSSKKYEDVFGEYHQVEILADGQQYVALGIHPGTGKEYQWSGGEVPRVAQMKDLGYIESCEIIQHFEKIAESEGWEVVSPGQRGEYVREQSKDPAINWLENHVEPVGLTLAEAETLLKGEDLDEYAAWVQVGMMLHHEFNGSFEALELWDKLSGESGKYSGFEDLETRWKGFSGGGANMRGLFDIKRDEIRPPEKTAVGEYLDRYIYIAEEDAVFDIKGPLGNYLKKPNFLTSKSNEFRIHTNDNGKTRKLETAKEWIEHPDRKTAVKYEYLPGDKVFWVPNPKHPTYYSLNSFYFPDHDKPAGRVDLSLFYSHLEYLFPVEVERKWFLQWMAFNVQQPQKRCLVTPLHVSKNHGTGRGWLCELMRAVLGGHNCSTETIKNISEEGQGTAYHNYLHNSLFCSVDEIREKNHKYSINEKIRSVLTEKNKQLNLKYGKNGDYQIYTNFFFMTNSEDAIHIPKDDRRINVFQGPDFFHPEEYYLKLYTWLEEKKNIAGLFYELKQLDISDFNYQRPLKTEAKQKMFEETMSKVEQAVVELKEDFQGKLFAKEEIQVQIAEYLIEDKYNINWKALNSILKENGFSAYKYLSRIDKRVTRICCWKSENFEPTADDRKDFSDTFATLKKGYTDFSG